MAKRDKKIPPGKIGSTPHGPANRLYNQSVESFFKIFNFAPGAMCITNQDEKLVEVNGTFSTLFGFGRDEALGRSIFELGIISEQEFRRIRKLSSEKGRLSNEEQCCTNRDFKILNCLTTTLPIKLGGKKYTLISFNDITRIKAQNKIIARQHREIYESLSYARNVQETFFPPVELLKKIVPDSFVFFKPRKIVSGDFYWMESHGDKLYIAAADCTGHGIPGALMTLVGYNLLRKSINDLGHVKPNEILDDLSRGVYDTLRPGISEHGSKDGMVISLVCIDTREYTMEYAGAFSPVLVIHNNRVNRLAADRFPVGKPVGHGLQKFTNNQVRLHRGDAIYLFSDGFADQFGGPLNKKFKNVRFRELLLSIHHLPMLAQLQILEETMEKWKGDEDQLDDMLVIGIQV